MRTCCDSTIIELGFNTWLELRTWVGEHIKPLVSPEEYQAVLVRMDKCQRFARYTFRLHVRAVRWTLPRLMGCL
jgi:hypothetical protein